nr:T9SS type A sorting domain-containing protein [candidate division Zixibacteria bacterium]
MYKWLTSLACLAFLLFTTAETAHPRDKYDDFNSTGSGQTYEISSTSEYDLAPIIGWPVDFGVQQTGRINASFDCYGHFGHNFFPGSPTTFPDWPLVSFESPPGSNIEYLFAGALWVGGIVGGDTLVSVGADGWQYILEMWPGNPPQPSITPFEDISDFAMRAEYYDTVTSPQYVGYDPYSGRPHQPMNLKIVNRSHAWHTAPYNETIIYDLVLTNIGSDYIEDAYLGCYIDGDVYSMENTSLGFSDDVTGSLSDEQIAYIIDNDGDPNDQEEFDINSPVQAIAFKYLETSFDISVTNYNWWISNGYADYDFGPRLAGTEEDPFRDFGGFLGTPEGDANKYYILSHNEWDYDQIESALDDSVAGWLPPSILALDFANGYDTRFLLSLGTFNLEPGQSARILYAMFTGDSVHTDPVNFEHFFSPHNPSIYLSNLDFNDVRANAAYSEYLAGLLLNPENPVIGLRITERDTGSIKVEWDPWVFPEVTGYQIMLAELPLDSIPHPGTIPPWLRPEAYQFYANAGLQTEFTFTDLDPDKIYYANVANISGRAIGNLGDPVIAHVFDPTMIPVPTAEFFFAAEDDPVTISWSAPEGGNIDHYNIYKFADEASAGDRFLPFYDQGENRASFETRDSTLVGSGYYYYYAMDLYAQVDGDNTIFNDAVFEDGNVYVITAVDPLGFESYFSDEITVYKIAPRTRDILVILQRSSYGIDRVYYDTLTAFYDSVLAGYDYDIYDYADSTSFSVCTLQVKENCVDWHDFMPYKLVIMDDGLGDSEHGGGYEEVTRGLTRYILSGGTFCYFGALSSFLGFSYNATTPAWYPINNAFVGEFFGIDSVYYPGLGYFIINTTPPFIDTLFGFIKAESSDGIAPTLYYDTLRYPFHSTLTNYWPANTAPSVAAFALNGKGCQKQTYRSRYPSTSLNENLPVGLMTETAGGVTYLFGYHLWYMNHMAARQLVDYMIQNNPTGTDDETDNPLPESFTLEQNHPNPFNAGTRIDFSLPRQAQVRLDIYNILGRRVRTLINEEKPAGVYRVEWDGCDDSRRTVASGLYFYRLSADRQSQCRKMLLLK